MKPGIYDFEAIKGTTFREVVTLKDAAGAAISFAGKTAVMQIRDAPGGALLFELNTVNQCLTLGTGGAVTLTVSAATSDALAPFEGVYLLALVTGTGVDRVVDPWLKGKFSLQDFITETV